jgi:hypothetical protein
MTPLAKGLKYAKKPEKPAKAIGVGAEIVILSSNNDSLSNIAN